MYEVGRQVARFTRVFGIWEHYRQTLDAGKQDCFMPPSWCLLSNSLSHEQMWPVRLFLYAHMRGASVPCRWCNYFTLKNNHMRWCPYNCSKEFFWAAALLLLLRPALLYSLPLKRKGTQKCQNHSCRRPIILHLSVIIITCLAGLPNKSPGISLLRSTHCVYRPF